MYQETTLVLGKQKESHFKDKVMELLPEGGNLNLCLTCGACVSGCPASGLEGMDPRKFLRLASLGMDDVIITTPWVWMCTMCERCVYGCPMKIEIPKLVYHARQAWPREKRPKGIKKSCDIALTKDTCSAVGAGSEDFKFVVEDVLDECRTTQPEFSNIQAPIDKKGAYFFLNQNSREPAVEAIEMLPLWKILHLAGADWTYGSKGWAAENYCMFLADDEGWEKIVRIKAEAVDGLDCKVWLNTE